MIDDDGEDDDLRIVNTVAAAVQSRYAFHAVLSFGLANYVVR